MNKLIFYLTTILFFVCCSNFTAKAFQLNIVDSKCDYTDWYDPPNCDNCIASVEIIEFKGKQYIAFWADHSYCSDAQTIIYNCNGTVFCKEGGIQGLTECSDAGVITGLKQNYTLKNTIWSKDKHCNNCCDNFIIYGNEDRNKPTAIKHYDGFTYVAGTIETDSVYATFTKFDAANSVVWERQFNRSTTIFDFVKTDDGFLLVGRTEPAMDNGPQNNQSILAKIDDNGDEVFIRSYDNGQRENFAKIVEHPHPVDPGFPFYLVAYENVSETTVSYADEVQLYNVNSNGDINWQVAYTSVAPNSFLDDQFARSLVTTSDGNLLLLGDYDGNSTTAAMLKISGNNGSVLSSFEGNNNTSFFDAKELSNDNIVLTGSQYNSGTAQAAFFMLLDTSLNVISSIVQNQVLSIRTLLVDNNDALYGIGQLPGDVPCIVKAEVTGSQIAINEMKAIPGDAVNYTIPVAQAAGNTLHYADGRDEISGNNMDMFLGFFDTALNDDCLERVPFKTDSARYILSPLTVNIADHVLPNPYNAIDLRDMRLPTEMDCEEPGVCCVDKQAFLDRINAPILTNAPGLTDCTLSIATTALTDCDQVIINWGDRPPLEGPYMGNVSLTHTYDNLDTYSVCMYFTEIDENGNACWEAANCFEVNANCEPDCVSACNATNSLNVSTGIDEHGDKLKCENNDIDPFWKLINMPPIQSGACDANNLSSTIKDGNAYLVNYNNSADDNWANQTGVGTIAPVDGSCYTSFGCNNLTNVNDEYLPYIFERTFCICEDDSVNINLGLDGDDRIMVELWDITNSTMLDVSPTYARSDGDPSPIWNVDHVLPVGTYALRAKLVNIGAVVLGFSISGDITSLSNHQSIVQDTICCENNTINVRKILDYNCNGAIDVTDEVGSGWKFELKNSAGDVVQAATTNRDGELFFNNVLAGEYTITEVAQPGWVFGTPASGTATITVVPEGFNVKEFLNCPEPVDTCCNDEEAFKKRVEDIITTIDGCELNVATTALTECDQVLINWGEGDPDEGPYMGNINETHIYEDPGIYEVCLYFTEIDETGKACWEATKCFEIYAECDCCDEIEHLKDRISYLEELVIGLNEKLEALNRIAAPQINEGKLQIYPNPNSGVFYAEYVVKEHSNNANLIITNSAGIEISTTAINCNGNCKSNLNLPYAIKAGIYYCTLYVNDTFIESTPFVYQP